MENTTEILVIGTNEKILETILRLLNTKEEKWKATGVSSPEDALAKCREIDYQILLLGAGLSGDTENQLQEDILAIRPGIKVVTHYGGGSGLLFGEIYLALGMSNQAQ